MAGGHRPGWDPDSYTVFALQNLPWACRASEYGVAADVLGTKPFMELVGRPASALPELSEVLGRLIRVPCPPVASGFLGVGLSNMCQVIHPAVMYDNFVDWDGKTPFDHKPLFYQGLSDEAADNMSQVSDEIQAVRAALEQHAPSLDLSIIHHVWDWCLRAYGKYITDDSTLRSRFSSNRAYVGLTCPMHEAPGSKDGALNGPDLAETFAPQRYGFHTLDDLPEIRDAK